MAVGLETYETTRAAINYAELEAVRLKGKSEPVRIFHATGVRSRTGVEATPTNTGAYVGRASELDRLQRLLSEIGATPPSSW